jgi:hypothetical protein
MSPATPAPAPTLTAGVRISEIDLLRGLVIVLMALDHVRDFFHAGSFGINPLDPEQTTPWLYVTRWITHLCAPTFVFLAGVSAYLQFARGKAVPDLSRFLLTRGLWLVFLELTVISFGWSFGFPYALFMQVIWAIGWSMIALAAQFGCRRWLCWRSVLRSPRVTICSIRSRRRAPVGYGHSCTMAGQSSLGSNPWAWRRIRSFRGSGSLRLATASARSSPKRQRNAIGPCFC